MIIQLVPQALVATYAELCGLDATSRSVIANAGRALWVSKEVDLAEVAAIDPVLAFDLQEYAAKCEAFWEGGADEPWVATRRTLCEAVQSDRKGSRVDLVAELTALKELPLVGPYVSELVRATPQPETLLRLGEPIDATLAIDGVWGTATFELGDGELWAMALGGVAGSAEERRIATLVVNWSGWRDRELRRLVRLCVEAEEYWPRPAKLVPPVASLGATVS